MNQLYLVPKDKTPDLRTKTGLACGRLMSSPLEQGIMILCTIGAILPIQIPVLQINTTILIYF